MLRPQTLMIAIQCLDAKIKEIDRHLDEDDPSNAAELEQLLVTFDLAADDLKSAYREALEKYTGLPPIDQIPPVFGP